MREDAAGVEPAVLHERHQVAPGAVHRCRRHPQRDAAVDAHRAPAAATGPGRARRSTETVPPARTAANASSSVASMATASITASAPRPPVASSTASSGGPSTRTAPDSTAAGHGGRRPGRPRAPDRRPGAVPTGRRTGRPRRARARRRSRPVGMSARCRAGPAGAEVVGQEQRRLVVDAVGDAEQLEVRGRYGEQLGSVRRRARRTRTPSGPGRRSPGRRSAQPAHRPQPATDWRPAPGRRTGRGVRRRRPRRPSPITSCPTATGKNGRSPS